MYFALSYSATILRKAIPARAERFRVRACCKAPQRQFDLRTRCFTKTITICMEVVCDKNKNILKLVLRLRLCLFVFFHKDLRGFCFCSNPSLVTTLPAPGSRRSRQHAVPAGAFAPTALLKRERAWVQTAARRAAGRRTSPAQALTPPALHPRGDGPSAQRPLPSPSKRTRLLPSKRVVLAPLTQRHRR